MSTYHIFLFTISIALICDCHFLISDDRKLAGNSDIQFYGRVLDQHGNPIANFPIHSTVEIEKDFYKVPLFSERTNSKIITTTTNDLGRFEFRTFGHSISIRPRFNENTQTIDMPSGERFCRSPVYDLLKRYSLKPAFKYANGHSDNYTKNLFVPDPDHPVDFHVWRLGQTSTLVRGEKRMGFINDAVKPGYLKIFSESQAEIGEEDHPDFIIKLSVEPTQPEQRAPAWVLSIQAAAGGLIPTEDKEIHQAPLEGYQPSIEIRGKEGVYHPALGRGERYVYFNCHNGRVYGVMRLNVTRAQWDPSRKQYTQRCEIDYYANPTGFRNLEYDPEKQMTTKDWAICMDYKKLPRGWPHEMPFPPVWWKRR